MWRSLRDWLIWRPKPPVVLRAATRIRIEMRIYRAAENKWYDLAPMETVI